MGHACSTRKTTHTASKQATSALSSPLNTIAPPPCCDNIYHDVLRHEQDAPTPEARRHILLLHYYHVHPNGEGD